VTFPNARYVPSCLAVGDLNEACKSIYLAMSRNTKQRSSQYWADSYKKRKIFFVLKTTLFSGCDFQHKIPFPEIDFANMTRNYARVYQPRGLQTLISLPSHEGIPRPSIASVS
jgi:hypothetical protein